MYFCNKITVYIANGLQNNIVLIPAESQFYIQLILSIKSFLQMEFLPNSAYYKMTQKAFVLFKLTMKRLSLTSHLI